MDAMKVNQQMLAFQKESFAAFQNLWELTQNQASDSVSQMMDQSPWMPEKGRQAMEKWLTLMNRERKRYTAYVERGFAIYDQMFSPPKAATAPKTKTKRTATAE
ncbi:hypothetical protein DSCA_38150 [Desulfosarcina alkanivorans]|jgi:hypothetical protein|uniref:Phasin domain-containing protein n=1 Tax=Desulfosarcina alkanivorans TaxID=571177 RepID=A0A5K7YND0_9BACT|nr:hypothetical protein [Desulfosarcina alkanivorans]BBO69885.1 hypothetical protein DSCA_38150 [Desulfosarcina alkanivorans]